MLIKGGHLEEQQHKQQHSDGSPGINRQRGTTSSPSPAHNAGDGDVVERVDDEQADNAAVTAEPVPHSTGNAAQRQQQHHEQQQQQQLPKQQFAVDVLYDGHIMWVLQDTLVETHNTHGTGCTLASAIAAELTKGYSVPTAVQRAKHWLTELLQASTAYDMGSGVQKPMQHGYVLQLFRRQACTTCSIVVGCHSVL